MTRISLFGGTGFIGSTYARLSENLVEVVDREQPNPTNTEIVYAIGTTDNYNIFDNPLLDIETNLSQLIKDLEILREKFGTFSFNYLSSWFVYGDFSPPPFKETQRCEPKGFYSISKFAAEMFLRSYCETYEIKYRILRLANVFGSGDRGVSRKKNALQYLINEIRVGNNVDVYEGGDFLRDYIDVRDVIRAIDLVIASNTQERIINIGTGEPSRFIELLEKAKIAFGSQSELNAIPTPNFHKKVQVRDAFMDIQILHSLGFKPNFRVLDEIINL